MNFDLRVLVIVCEELWLRMTGGVRFYQSSKMRNKSKALMPSLEPNLAMP